VNQLSVKPEMLKKLLHPEDASRVFTLLGCPPSAKEARSIEYRIIRPDGRLAWIHSVCKLQHDLNGTPLGVVGTARDVTLQKENEESLRAAIADREALLRGIRRRVQSCLALVISMIELQTETTPEEARVKLRELESHARTMAFAQEILTVSGGNKERIDFGAFLAMLSQRLKVAVAGDNAIALEAAPSDLALDADTAVSCGLIVSELVTNALRHAFPGNKCSEPGEINCRVRVGMRREGNIYTLTVSDNGVGLPGDPDWRTKPSLGMKIVDMLGRQLGGHMEVHRAGGTEFKLTFCEEH
jgi:two-component sensor histidine kinase